MRLRLLREPSDQEATLGALFVEGRFFCWTLEDQVREVPGQPVAAWKIPAITAIPFGVYQVRVTPSPRFKRNLPLVEAVPGFEGVRFHRGNTAKDTEGCIIVGATRAPAFVAQSTYTERRLVDMLGTDVHQLTIERA